MSANQQLALLEGFETSRPPNLQFCHREFLEKPAEHGRDAIGRRAALLMQRLSVDIRRLHYKAAAGINRGWRRSRLGGNHGSQLYAWWAPKNAAPLKESGEFSEAPDGASFLRDIRHREPTESHGPPSGVENRRSGGNLPGCSSTSRKSRLMVLAARPWSTTYFLLPSVLLLNHYDWFDPVTKGLENLPNGVREAVMSTAFATRPAIASTGAMLLSGKVGFSLPNSIFS